MRALSQAPGFVSQGLAGRPGADRAGLDPIAARRIGPGRRGGAPRPAGWAPARALALLRICQYRHTGDPGMFDGRHHFRDRPVGNPFISAQVQ
jgi:hypothetical protein